MAEFFSEVFQNEYLPEGGTDVNAVVAIKRSQTTADALSWAAGEIIVVDSSASMNGKNYAAAKHAAAAAIDQIPDGVAFALVKGTHRAYLAYPKVSHGPGMTVMSSTAREEAKQALADLRPDGGTAIGTWLKLSKALFESTSIDNPRHVLIFTDGGNHNETPAQLNQALSSCTGFFTTDWLTLGKPNDLKETGVICAALGGKVTELPPPEQLGALLALILRQHSHAIAAQTHLQVWTPLGAQLLYLRQVSPDLKDLSGNTDGQNVTFEVPDWVVEEREYHLGVRLPPQALGREQMAARVSLRRGSEVLTQSRVLAKWVPATAVTDFDVFVQPPRHSEPVSAVERATTILRAHAQPPSQSGQTGLAEDAIRSQSPSSNFTDLICDPPVEPANDLATTQIRVKRTGGEKVDIHD
ncbi:MAG: VWA domain-containing protein [Propionibacteriaceae bacterium]|nr:VWA domain-containing protein [Propionibacteriaceae bacterium]